MGDLRDGQCRVGIFFGQGARREEQEADSAKRFLVTGTCAAYNQEWVAGSIRRVFHEAQRPTYGITCSWPWRLNTNRSAEAVVQAGVVYGGQANSLRFPTTAINVPSGLPPACDAELLK